MENISFELIPARQVDPVEIFKTNGLDPILGAIKAKVDEFEPNLKTDAGRKEIASMARKVASSKKTLEEFAKKLTEGWRTQTAQVNAEKNRMIEFLDNLKVQVRQPLTDYENKERDRLAKHEANIAKLASFALVDPSKNTEALRNDLAELQSITVSESWEEFELRAIKIKQNSVDVLTAAIQARGKYEDEQRELQRLREETARREQEDCDRKIAEAAAERARQEEQQKAQAERERIEREKQEAIRRQKEAEEAAERAEQKRIADIERAKREEREKIEAQKRREADEARKREEDIQHKREVNNAAAKALCTCGVVEDVAKEIVKAIALGGIPNVKIFY